MLATHTKAEPTPVSFEEAAEAMTYALTATLGYTPPIETRSLALAKTALEAGRKDDKFWAYSKCWNIGNIKAGPKYTGQYCTYTCNEVLGGKVVWFSPHGRLSGRGGVVVAEQSADPPGHPQTRFRAYANRFDACLQYVDFIASGRYIDAYRELCEGDAAGYVKALHAKGYFTADPVVYGQGVVSLQREFIARLRGKPAATMYTPEVEVIAAMIIRQAWNQKEIQAIATEAAASSLADNLLDLRGDANDQMAIDPDDIQEPDHDETTRRDPPRNS